MSAQEQGSVATRESLLQQLKAGESEGWKRFYGVYGKLVFDFALKAGLSETEADEVVQDTAIAVSRHIAEFQYERDVCRFKTWLLNQATWRIKDQWKKRARAEQLFLHSNKNPRSSPKDERTATIERVPDERIDYARMFEIEWQKNVLRLAEQTIRSRFDPKQIQIYDLHAVQGWPAREVARALAISVALVYVTKHRISATLKAEVARLGADQK